MDSRTITASPAATRSPGLAAIWNTTPVMCALISSAIERSLFDHLRVHPSHTERVAREGATEERHRRFHARSEEHTSELQSPCNIVCRLLLEKKKIIPH